MLADPLIWLARHGRACLVAGLLAGLLLPALAQTLRPWLPQMVAGLLFLTAIRIGPRAALGSLTELRGTLGLVLAYQVALPLAALAGLAALGLAATPAGIALVLMLAAPSVTGAPNFTIMMGRDPAPALRLVILGTALMPLTVLPVFWAAPALGGVEAVLAAAGRLFAVIFGAVALGFAVRRLLLRAPTGRQSSALDGAAALFLAVLVVGLMAALGPALKTEPGSVAGWLALAFAANFGLQAAARLVLGRQAVGPAIVAGNRNIALFLVAMPPEITGPLLIFIGCYQVPMYLTPILLRRLYR